MIRSYVIEADGVEIGTAFDTWSAYRIAREARDGGAKLTRAYLDGQRDRGPVFALVPVPDAAVAEAERVGNTVDPALWDELLGVWLR